MNFQSWRIQVKSGEQNHFRLFRTVTSFVYYVMCIFRRQSVIQNPCYYQVYIVWLNIIFNAIIPFLVLIILNAYILHYLILNERRGSSKRSGNDVNRGKFGKQISLDRESSRLRIHHHPSQMRKRENKVALAKVSLAIVFIFIICHSIKWIPNIYEFYWVRILVYFFEYGSFVRN